VVEANHSIQSREADEQIGERHSLRVRQQPGR
jgi:hypothetical protein